MKDEGLTAKCKAFEPLFVYIIEFHRSKDRRICKQWGYTGVNEDSAKALMMIYEVEQNWFFSF